MCDADSHTIGRSGTRVCPDCGPERVGMSPDHFFRFCATCTGLGEVPVESLSEPPPTGSLGVSSWASIQRVQYYLDQGDTRGARVMLDGVIRDMGTEVLLKERAVSANIRLQTKINDLQIELDRTKSALREARRFGD